MVFLVHSSPKRFQRLRFLHARLFAVSDVDGSPLAGLPRTQRQIQVNASLIWKIAPEYEIRKQGEIARADRQRAGRPSSLGLTADVHQTPETVAVDDGAMNGQRLVRGGAMHHRHVLGLDEVLQKKLPVGLFRAKVDHTDEFQRRKINFSLSRKALQV